MTTERIPFSERDLQANLNQRVSLDYTRLPKVISGKIINDAISLNKLLNQNSGVYIDELIFITCTFNKTVDIGDYRNAGKVTFKDNCIFNEPVTIREYAPNGNVKFSEDCEFKNNLTISIPNNSEVTISDLKIQNGLTISGGNIRKLVLSNIGSSIQEQMLYILAKCQEFQIDNVYFNEVHLLTSTGFYRNASIENLNTNKLMIDGVELMIPLCIKHSKIKEIEFKEISGTLRHLQVLDDCIITDFNLPLNQFAKIDISDCTIKTLELTETNGEDNILNIEKATLTNLKFQKAYNNGLITLRELNILPGSMISIKSSNLGKTDFINCDFSKATMEFENSKVTEVFLSETDFPKQVKNNGILNYSQAQLAFGQFNTAFQNQGDTIRALEYQSREVEAHYNNLKKWVIPRFPILDFTKLNLWLNKWSNNFGRYWARGIVFTFVIAFVFFNLTINSTDSYDFSFHFNKNMVGPFLKFINPLRHFDLETLFKTGEDIPNIGMNPITHVWDFLGRVFVAYGFYQTIQAFRRFGRK